MQVGFSIATSMKILKAILMLSILLLGSCTDSPVEDLPIVPPSMATVEICVQPSPQEQLTRATDEEGITDVNFYLFHEDGTPSVSGYTVSVSPLRFDCTPGRYRLYLIANLHRELGRMEESALRALRIEHSASYDTLPMSAVADIEISQTAGVVTLPSIEVRRNVARIEYDIRIDEAMKGLIELEQVCYVNLPKFGMPFSQELPQAFVRSDAISVQSDGHSDSFYLFPNEQGCVPEITAPQERNRDNAPQNATYLLIYARYNKNRVVNYVVYLGENTTDDFNVRRNGVQVLSITIKGINMVDTRVDTYMLLHQFTADRIGDYCVPGEYRGYLMRRGGKNDATAVTGRYEWLEGDASLSGFLADGAPGDVFGLPRNMQIDYRFSYIPRCVTADNCKTRHRFTVTDYMDHVTTFDMPLRWANSLIVQCPGGSVTSPDALAEDTGTGAMRFACIEGCRLRATPASDYGFEGWYRDARYTELLSAQQEYTHRQTAAKEVIYARFSTRQVMIYTDIDTVDFACNKVFTIDRERRAFCVPVGSECTISARPTSYIINWYDSYDLENAGWIDFGMPYTFIASEDRTIAPQHRTEYPLDMNGTANCYIFTPETALRSFDATVQGNGRATKNIPPKKIKGGAKAVVLWHTGHSSPVGQVAYRDGRIYFVTASGGTGANAVIGLLDAAGNVLWSWHIWRTADPEANAQTYPDGRTFMDRNLGSTGARTSDGEAVVQGYGFYYQWGRKDPFIYPNRYSETRPCTDASYTEGFKPRQTTYTTATTPEWAAAHPTTFINGSELWPDWLPRINMNLWGNPAATIYNIGGKSVKTIYDPCPPGWKVPDENAWLDEAFYIDRFYGIGCMYLATSYMNQYYYPVGGYFLNGTFMGVDSQAVYWTDSPAKVGQSTQYRSDASSAMIVTTTGAIPRYSGLRRDAAAMVRCMKDE